MRKPPSSSFVRVITRYSCITLIIIVLIVSGLFTVHAVNRSALATLGAPGVWVGSVFDGWMGVTTRTEDGTKVSYQDQHHMGVTDTGVLFAPKPVRQFRGATCDLTPRDGGDTVRGLGDNTWVAPGVKDKALNPVTAHVTPAGAGGAPIVLPSAPEGIVYADGAQLSDTTGAVVEAGHVNYDDGKDLSPWGYLHRVGECDHVYQKDTDGRVYEFVVTDVYTVPQKELETQGELWRKDGEKALYLVTCSGRSVGEDGTTVENTLLFDYEYNLVVRAAPVRAL